MTEEREEAGDVASEAAPEASFTPPTAFEFAVKCLTKWQSVLAYDEFAGRVVLQSKPPPPVVPGLTPGYWTDNMTSGVRLWLSKKARLNVDKNSARDAVEFVARMRVVNPVRAWLEGLTWDGKSRLDTWLITYGGVEDGAANRAVFAKWMISGVARVYQPGCKADHVLILEGPQGAGKSSFFDILGGEWYSPLEAALGSKDSIQSLFSKWIVELPELAAVRRASDIERVKSFVTTRVDHLRLPYGRDFADYPRQCILGGTTNEAQWLHEDSGRRWWPLKVNKDALWASLPQLRADREQLWAEAAARYKAGEKWFIDDEGVLADLAKNVAARRVVDDWETTIDKWLRANGRQRTSTVEILKNVLGFEIGNIARGDQMRVAGALTALGWERRQVMEDNLKRWYYHAPAGWKPLTEGLAKVIRLEEAVTSPTSAVGGSSVDPSVDR